MEASTRLIAPSSSISRRLLAFSSFRNPNPNPRITTLPSRKLPSYPRNAARPSVRLSFSSPNPRHRHRNPFLSLSSSSSAAVSTRHQERISRPDLDPDARSSDRARNLSDRGDLGFCGGEKKGAIWTVVLLGWLGAEEKHMKRYAEVYGAMGMRAVRFVVPVGETVGLDLCKNVEDRVRGLAEEVDRWCKEEEDGRERYLVFHTFSNTGWLVYGVLLQNFQSRNYIIRKIKGCIVDSAPSAEISPQVWAAGYCAALMKKRSSSLVEPVDGSKLDLESSGLNPQEVIPALIEIIVLKVLEVFFSIVLMLPYTRQCGQRLGLFFHNMQAHNKRLGDIISTLKNQPPCPQLYLYSSADKVIPATVIESFIKEQKALGRDVHAHNFGSSPHVDHYRNFLHIYSSKVIEFVKHCCSKAVSNT